MSSSRGYLFFSFCSILFCLSIAVIGIAGIALLHKNKLLFACMIALGVVGSFCCCFLVRQYRRKTAPYINVHLTS